MVVSSPPPFKTSPTGGARPPAPNPNSDASGATASQAAGPSCDRRSRGMGQFPPRLAREPRNQQSPHANVNLPQLPLRSQARRSQARRFQANHSQTRASASKPIPPLALEALAGPGLESNSDNVLTLDMRPTRSPVSGFWHRLRFNGFSPMTNQRRSGWKPGRPRRGRPEGTKGAGSRSI